LVGLLLVAGQVAGAGPAAAHTTVVEVRPADGAVLDRPVQQVELVFDHPVRGPVTVVVAGPDGAPVMLGSPRLDGAVVTQALAGTGPAESRAGRYQVGYRVVGDDGHPVVGQVAFSVGAGTGSADDGGAGPGPDRPATWVGLGLLAAGLVLAMRRRTRAGGPGSPPVLLAPAALLLGALVTALAAGGGAPLPAPAGLPDPGPVTGWGLRYCAGSPRPAWW
jgi:copper resistance protein C